MSSQDRPVILGGTALIEQSVPLARPSLGGGQELDAAIREILDTGILTKGRHVSAFEHEVAEFLGVADAVAVSSCTTGLMLVMRALDLRGEVVLPSFTFMASGHAVRWNGLTPVFADIDPRTFTLTPETAAQVIGPQTTAILGVHTFGTPCDSAGLAALAADAGVPLVTDAAPAFGATYADGAMAGSKGIAEVFSLSPTKPFTTGEGGIVTTNDADLARRVRVGREYGNDGDYGSTTVGLSGRLPELSAALGRANLPSVPAQLTRRRELARRYQSGLAEVPGIGFQDVPAGATSTLKDFCLTVDPGRFLVDRNGLADALRAEGIATRSYYDPPMHRQEAYRREDGARRAPLANTELLAARALTIPLHLHLDELVVDRICGAIRRIHDHGPQVAAVTRSAGSVSAPAPAPSHHR
ncbi:MAG TPA: DegT/DnrJ/EryC1/StrS family aminotransferase [Micromonosporaceae bacterium]|nr:DegT/DnrJ/EryC1/StrS family aminotransferase [Micromonosporaceae bacterium]